MRRSAEYRFWFKVDQFPEGGGCWEWLGSRSRGYGMFYFEGRMHQAHRVAYRLITGEFPPTGREVMHSCDNPPCVYPGHLSIGTHAENMADCGQKGRGGAGQPKGEGHAQARLTDADVEELRTRHEAGASYAELGCQFGIHETYASMLARGIRRQN